VTYSLKLFLSGGRLLPSATLGRVVPLWNRTWVISIKYCRYFVHAWLQCAYSAKLCQILVCLTVCTYKNRTKIRHDLFLHSYLFSLFVNSTIFFFSPSGAHKPIERTLADFLSYQEMIKNQSLHYNTTHTVHHVLPCPFIYQLQCTILCFFTHILFLAHKYTTLGICEKNTIFNRQLKITHKYFSFVEESFLD
jgi:hypothetical protein